MGLVLDPAALGGLAGMIALAGWALGRMQGRLVQDRPVQGHVAKDHGAQDHAAPGDPERSEPVLANPPAPVSPAPSPCQQRAFEERRAIFERPVALAELHDQVRSIRRDERVLDQGLSDTGLLLLLARGSGGACRYLGRSGRPTCPGPVNGACHHGGGCTVTGLHAPRAAPTDPAHARPLATR